jgi:hypothetical protein
MSVSGSAGVGTVRAGLAGLADLGRLGPQAKVFLGRQPMKL